MYIVASPNPDIWKNTLENTHGAPPGRHGQHQKLHPPCFITCHESAQRYPKQTPAASAPPSSLSKLSSASAAAPHLPALPLHNLFESIRNCCWPHPRKLGEVRHAMWFVQSRSSHFSGWKMHVLHAVVIFKVSSVIIMAPCAKCDVDVVSLHSLDPKRAVVMYCHYTQKESNRAVLVFCTRHTAESVQIQALLLGAESFDPGRRRRTHLSTLKIARRLE